MEDLKSKPAETIDAPRMPRAMEPTRIVDEVAEEFAERAAAVEDGRNPIFDILVRDETDLNGLVAYALYKQNKRDWLIAFGKTHARQPDERELASYILGERTPRRIETYRRLAGDALATHNAAQPRPGGVAKADSPPPRAADASPFAAPGRAPIEPARVVPRERSNSLVTLASGVVVAVVVLYLLYRFGGALFGR